MADPNMLYSSAMLQKKVQEDGQLLPEFANEEESKF